MSHGTSNGRGPMAHRFLAFELGRSIKRRTESVNFRLDAAGWLGGRRAGPSAPYAPVGGRAILPRMPEEIELNPPPPGPIAGGHVLHIADREAVARFGLMLVQSLQGLAASGVRPALLTDDIETLRRLEAVEIEGHFTGALRGWRAWRLGRQLAARFTSRPTVVHVWGTPLLRPVQRWLGQHGVPTVVHALGASQVGALLRRGLRSNERIATMSSGHLEPLLRKFPLATGSCQVLPPAVAVPIHPERTPDPSRTLTVMAVVQFDRSDALNVLIDAVAQLRSKQRDVQAMVLGLGTPGPGTWQRIRERAVQDCVGLINEPVLWEHAVGDVDVCVVPAREDDPWLAPLLAMGFGKVVLASRDQSAEWFVNDRTCWHFTPGSHVELAYLLERIREYPQHAAELSARAMEHVREHHPMSLFISRLLTVYESALTGTSVATAAVESEKRRGANMG